MKITIDARAAGQGKTTQGIYSRLRKNQAFGQKTLVVVPSIKLQADYQKAFPQMRVINSAHEKTEPVPKVGQEILAALQLEDMICITQAAFLNLPFDQTRLFKDFDLVLDEIFQPFDVVSITANGKLTGLDFAALLNIDPRALTAWEGDDQNYFALKIDTRAAQNQNLWRMTQDLQRLSSQAYEFEITRKSYDSIVKGTAEVVYAMGMLRPEVLTSFASVHIAAAAFERTVFADWINEVGLSYEVLVPFKPHNNGRVRFHIASEPNINHIGRDVRQPLRLSKTRRKSTDIDSQFMAYIEQNLPSQARVLWQANKDSEIKLDDVRSSIESSTEATAEINHLPHGLNEFTDFNCVVLTSAIRLNTMTQKWLNQKFGHKKGNGFAERVVAYNFYQSVLRTGIRKPGFDGEVDVYVLDGVAGNSLMTEYFDLNSKRVEHIDIPLRIKSRELSQTPGAIRERARRAAKAAGTYAKKIPMTPAERKRKCLAKKKAQALHSNTSN